MNPVTRKEKFLAKAAGEFDESLPTPVTREEHYLKAIAENSGGGGFTPTEEQLTAMNSGIDSEKVAQIATNAQNISGKQDTIDSSHKLSSDLVDDTNQTNKFVTAAEKTKITNALTEEEFNAGKQVTTGNKIGEIFNDYSSNTAIGDYSHAEGVGTIASGYCQHVQGKYNIEDIVSKYAFIIGNGSNNKRINAFSIDWDGKIYVKNAVTGVDVSTLQSTVTDIQTTIGNINAVLEEVL